MEAQEILNYIIVQKEVFEEVFLERDKDDEYMGIMKGLEMVAEFIKKGGYNVTVKDKE